MMIAAESLIPSPTQPESTSSFNLGASVKQNNNPNSNATMGSPMKSSVSLSIPPPKGRLGKFATDFSAINTMGNTSGVNAVSALGRF